MLLDTAEITLLSMLQQVRCLISIGNIKRYLGNNSSKTIRLADGNTE